MGITTKDINSLYDQLTKSIEQHQADVEQRAIDREKYEQDKKN